MGDAEFYGLEVGDQVLAHGQGLGTIIEASRGSHPRQDSVLIESRGEHRCECGHEHEWVERRWMHPRHVSLTVYERKRKALAD